MLSIRKINPMARAIGTMGAVVAIAGGITFASLSSNTVALTPNDLTTSSAALAIGAGSTCPTGDTSSTPGLSDSALVPGGSPATASFCLDNTGTTPLLVTASIPDNLSGSTAAAYTNLGINCTDEGSIAPAQLSTWSGGAFQNDLAPGAADNCTVSASLLNTYPGQGNETIPSFTINFVGNQ